MSDIFMGCIAAFAKTGEPNRTSLPSAPPWPRYHAAKSELMMFIPDAAAIVQADPWKAWLDLVERAVEAQRGRRNSQLGASAFKSSVVAGRSE